MHFILSVIIGVLAAIGALTLIAIASVISFGDKSLKVLRGW